MWLYSWYWWWIYYSNAYFRSKLKKYQTENIFNAKYCWLSHGHPDHLDIESLNLIKESKILVPDHFGGRIYRDLKDQGFDVMIIKSGTSEFNFEFEKIFIELCKNCIDFFLTSSAACEFRVSRAGSQLKIKLMCWKYKLVVK